MGGPIESLCIYTFSPWSFSPNSSITLGKLPFTPDYSGPGGRISRGRDYSGDSAVCVLRLPGLRSTRRLEYRLGCDGYLAERLRREAEDAVWHFDVFHAFNKTALIFC